MEETTKTYPTNRREFLTRIGLLMGSGFLPVSLIEGVVFAATQSSMEKKLITAKEAVDHLVFGFSDLDRGIEWAEKTLGVKAVFGGVHPGAGTRNALISLGKRQYLEIIAPDPAQGETIGRFGDLKKLTSPKMLTWAAATNNVEEVLRKAKAAGHSAAGPFDGSRARPDGKMLKWRTVHFDTQQLSWVIPFFIEWGTEVVHPAEDSPKGCSLSDLSFEHPQVEKVRSLLGDLGIDARVEPGSEPKIHASLKTLRGDIVRV